MENEAVRMAVDRLEKIVKKVAPGFGPKFGTVNTYAREALTALKPLLAAPTDDEAGERPINPNTVGAYEDTDTEEALQWWIKYGDEMDVYADHLQSQLQARDEAVKVARGELEKAVEALANNIQLYFDQMAYEERGDNVCERDLRQALAAYRAQVTKEGGK